MTGISTPWQEVVSNSFAIAIIVASIAYVVAAWKNGTAKSNMDTITTYRNELDAVKCTIERMREEYELIKQQNSQLQGQVDVLKNLPLKGIDDSMKEFGKILNAIEKSNQSLMKINSHILERMQEDAVVLKADTKHVAEEVANVKADLAHTSPSVGL